MKKIHSTLLCALVLALAFSCSKKPSAHTGGSPLDSAALDPTSSVYWTYAEDTHNYVVGNLLTSYNS
jgi:hypothetical protein